MSRPTTFAEALALLSEPIPQKFIKKKPDASKAEYVPHHVIRQYLHSIFDDHRFETLSVEQKGEGQYAMNVRLTVSIGGETRCYDGWGESENRKAPLKSAESDAVKRIAAMHLGLGLHLWSREHYFLPAALAKNAKDAAASVPESADYGGDGDEEGDTPEPVAKPAAKKTAAKTVKPSGGGDRPMSEGQRRKMFATLKDKGVDDAARKSMMQGRYGIGSSSDLTFDQATDLIEHLNGLPDVADQPTVDPEVAHANALDAVEVLLGRLPDGAVDPAVVKAYAGESTAKAVASIRKLEAKLAEVSV